MKALTLTQPWATLVAFGAKRVETRSWSTHYRGKLAIHAAKGFPRDARDLCLTEPFWSALTGDGAALDLASRGEGALPLGMVLAVADLVDVLPCNRTPPPSHSAEHELAFGDYSPGRFAWILSNVELLPRPIPAKGALGLWEWSP